MSYNQLDDTIAAIATPFGLGGIGIIRISGSKAKNICKGIFFPRRNIKTLKSHRLYLGNLVDPSTGQMIDEVLLSYMKAPNSYTKEDIVEINSHSGHILLSRILQIIINEGARLALPGEFTFRAFTNGRIDLTQAEAIVDLINAKSDKGLELASRHIKGELRTEIETLRRNTIEILANAEVAIDFPEEEAEIISREETALLIEKGLINSIEKIIAACTGRKIWMDGINTVIAGRVNVGKSSLLNYLLNEQRSIVTPIPGTTRDIIESLLYIDGIPLRLIDTAGIRKDGDEVEKIGIQIAEKKLEEADLALIVIDQSIPLNQTDLDMIGRYGNRPCLIIINKIDLPMTMDENELGSVSGNIPVVRISALTGQGIANLRKAIRDIIIGSSPAALSSSLSPNLRHKQALVDSLQYFQSAAKNAREMAPMEIITEDLNSAMVALGEIIGETSNEEIYDKIFSDFCLGK